MTGSEDAPEADSDLRRRAAWLLGMLAIVAVLVVVVMSQVIGTSGGGSKKGLGPGALDSVAGQHPSSSATTNAPKSSSKPPTHSSAPGTSGAPSSGPSGSGVHGVKCPGTATCVLAGDPGNGIAAINDYRTQHGQDAVVGGVSGPAQQCALNNGNGCTGGWAETELANPDGPAAVQKILPFAHLLDPMKKFAVGWAYDPKAKLYYFSIIRDA